MTIAIISDVHGNMDALQAVLDDIDGFSPDAIYCLGDNVGYGAEPERVVQCLHRWEIPSVLGNHEMAVIRPETMKNFNPTARQSLVRSLSLLSDETVDLLRSYPTTMVAEGCRFVHGFPPDSFRAYLFGISEKGLIRTFNRMTERICFVGHTHELELVKYDGQQLERRLLSEETIRLQKNRRYIFNIGSVGQPRDGNHCAKYAVWDQAADTVEIRYVPYDIESAVAKILSAGLPKGHAFRLR